MKNYFSYQFCINLKLSANDLLLPRYLRELAELPVYTDQHELENFFYRDLKEATLTSDSEVAYFQFLVHTSLTYHLHKQDFDSFEQVLEMVRHRMVALRNSHLEINIKGWEGFIDFFEVSFLRIMRHAPLERFEKMLDSLNWDVYTGDFLAKLSSLIGYVYLHESDDEQAAKSRLWLQKALYETPAEDKLVVYLYMGQYFLRKRDDNTDGQISDLVDKLRQEEVHPDAKPFFKAAAFQLDAQRFRPQYGGALNGQNPEDLAVEQLDKLRTRFEKFSEANSLPPFISNELASIVAQHYGDIADEIEEEKVKEAIVTPALKLMDLALAALDGEKWPDQQMRFRMTRANISAQGGITMTEKEMKEILTHYRKALHYPDFLEANRVFMIILDLNGNGIKAMDLFAEIFKQGHKRMEQGGFALLLGGMEVGNEILERETRKSGVSWIVEQLKDYFVYIKEAVDLIPNYIDELGTDAIEQFRKSFAHFEPISKFNIYTYFSYQLYQLKMLKIGALMTKDKVSLQVVNRLITNLTHENNPLNFITGDWEEFKEVPNSVRNKTLNQCINISKGDLPLAAEHLDFSYRNLRSYITFKEVNRLGFFLDISQTTNRQLEQGIRFMFYDLYKNGTIFEVVFDMPKFLVRFAKKGFYSSDLEKELNIKGTTAKKYIKIMTEIGLIKQDKTTGRKHFYRLIRENVMKRIGQAQTNIIRPEA